MSIDAPPIDARTGSLGGRSCGATNPAVSANDYKEKRMMPNKSFSTKTVGARGLAVVAGVAVVMLATGGGVTAALANPNPPPPAPKPATLTVGNSATCKGATYPTINAAVTAANSGDTIKVCAGNYPENVMVTKPLTFLGAQAGKDGRQHNNPSTESVVANASGADFTLSGAADHVTINGFTLSGVDSNSTDYGVSAFQGTSGLVVTDNIITGNCEGMNFQNPNGSMPASISRNAFSNNTAGAASQGANCGTGVFISNGPANNTTITQNSFSGQNSGQTAINFAGDESGTNPSVGLSVTNNSSLNDSTFVVAIDSKGALIANNTVTVTNPTNQGTAILDYGSNVNLAIKNNMINGGASSGSSGINVRAITGTPSVNTVVMNNHVSNRYNGIRVTDGVSGATISGNQISGSANDGIFMENGSSNTFANNQVQKSAVHDCQDLTTGNGTVGTANTWTKDSGTSNNSSPAAICQR
jgi:parallel beta-helix repeat protein